MRGLNNARHLQSELLEQISIPVVNRHDARDSRVGEPRCGVGLDDPEPPSIVGRVLLERGGILRPEPGEGALNRVGLLDGVRKGDERVGVDAIAAFGANRRRLRVDAEDRRSRVARRLQHRQDEVVVSDAVDDDDVEIGKPLDVLRPRLIVTRVDITRQQRAHLVPGSLPTTLAVHE